MTERREGYKSSEAKLSRQLDQASWIIGKHRRLQFTATGVRLFNMVETGETQLVGSTIGETMEIYANVAIREPLPDSEYPDLGAFLEANGGKRRNKQEDDEEYSEYRESDASKSGNVGKPITTPEFLAWKETLPSEEDIMAAIHRLAELPPEERAVEGEYSEKEVEYPCLCTEGGVVLLDFVEGDKVSLREKGEPDPDCLECSGTGKMKHIWIDNPRAKAQPRDITLVNEITGESINLALDLPRLVTDAEMDVDIGLGTRRFASKEREKKYLMEEAGFGANFQVNKYIAKQAKRVGIDMGNAFVVREGGAVGPEWEFQDWGVGFSWRWHNHNGEINSREPDNYKNLETLIQRAQSGLREHGTVILRPAGKEEIALAEIRAGLEKRGCTLGLGLGFVATEEYGPAFYVLDEAGNFLGELAVGYKSDAELETVLQRVRFLPEQLLEEG